MVILAIVGMILGVIETLITILTRRQANGQSLGPLEKAKLGHLLNRIETLKAKSAEMGCTAADDLGPTLPDCTPALVPMDREKVRQVALLSIGQALGAWFGVAAEQKQVLHPLGEMLADQNDGVATAALDDIVARMQS